MSIQHQVAARARRLILFCSLVSVTAACGDSTTGPPIPPLVRVTAVYEDTDSTSHRSRYVLYNDTTFSLQYWRRGSGPFDYRGRYVATDSVINFSFDFFNLTGPWHSTGVLRGDEMIVSYNAIMAMVDFIGGRHVRTPGPG